jgi:uncharacterized protein (TIGR00369 family)
MIRQETDDARKIREAVHARMKRSGATRLMGFSLEALERGRAVMRMDVRERHKQVHGVVHGGVLATLADTTAALAAYSVLPRGQELATIELKINYMLPISEGPARAEGRVLRVGRNFVVTECEIRTHKGDLAAKALLTFGAASGKRLG